MSAQGIGTAIQGVGQLQQGDAAQKADQYNAAVATTNANAIAQESPIAVAQVQRKAMMVEGAAKAQYGASGVQGGTGSPLLVLQQSAAQGALDEALVEHKYAMQEYGYRSSAALDLFEGEQAKTSSKFAAVGSFINAGVQSATGGSGNAPTSVVQSTGGSGSSGGGSSDNMGTFSNLNIDSSGGNMENIA